MANSWGIRARAERQSGQSLSSHDLNDGSMTEKVAGPKSCVLRTRTINGEAGNDLDIGASEHAALTRFDGGCLALRLNAPHS
jgi:hypothetical protein